MTKSLGRIQMDVLLSEAIDFSLDLPIFFKDAVCVGEDPGIFDGEHPERVLQAKQICASCPIQAMCLDWATQTQDAGVWGGLTPDERKAANKGNLPVNIGELRLLETHRNQLLSETPAGKLAAEFEVTERTIYRWRKKINLNKKAS